LSVDCATVQPKFGASCSGLDGDTIVMATYQFPDGFVWGVATAATQIEGAASRPCGHTVDPERAWGWCTTTWPRRRFQ
jgi:Glycosyl hydrolase family 1